MKDGKTKRDYKAIFDKIEKSGAYKSAYENRSAGNFIIIGMPYGKIFHDKLEELNKDR